MFGWGASHYTGWGKWQIRAIFYFFYIFNKNVLTNLTFYDTIRMWLGGEIVFEKDLVLYNPQMVGEPLFIEFKKNVFVGNKDQIICEITLEQAYKILEHSYWEYLEDKIYIPADVIQYIERSKEEERAMWEQINKTEETVKEILEEKRRRGNKIWSV